MNMNHYPRSTETYVSTYWADCWLSAAPSIFTVDIPNSDARGKAAACLVGKPTVVAIINTLS